MADGYRRNPDGSVTKVSSGAPATTGGATTKNPLTGLDKHVTAATNSLANGDKAIGNAFNAGQSLGNQFYGPGSLGRFTDQFGGMRNPLQGMYMSGLGGMTQPEQNAFMDTGTGAINTGQQMALRNLRSSFAGAQGPAATIAAQPIVMQGMDQMRQLGNDMSNANLQLKDNRLNNAAGFLNNNQQFGLLGQAYNNNQMGQELGARTGYIFNSGAFGAQQENANKGFDIQKQAVDFSKSRLNPLSGMSSSAGAM